MFDIDKRLYAEMENHYTSNAEQIFFEKQHWKALHQNTMYELILETDENEDGLYLIRYSFTEYELGVSPDFSSAEEIHTMTLAEILNVNLKEAGFLDRNITFHEWLRERDYKGIHYDRIQENF